MAILFFLFVSFFILCESNPAALARGKILSASSVEARHRFQAATTGPAATSRFRRGSTCTFMPSISSL
jgi:hypothetical protein